MGQKTSPIALRLDINRQWDSSWNSPYHYENLLGREIQLRKYFARVFQRANLLCGRLVIHWNPQSIQIYPFLFPGKPKKKKHKKTKSKLARSTQTFLQAKEKKSSKPSKSSNELSHDSTLKLWRKRLAIRRKEKRFAKKLEKKRLRKLRNSSRIVEQIESQKEKTLQKRAHFHKQVLFQRQNLVKTSLRFRKSLTPFQQLSTEDFWKIVESNYKPSEQNHLSKDGSRLCIKFLALAKASFTKGKQVKSDVLVLDEIFHWDSKKHLWQRKKYLASWGISSYRKQKIKKAGGNLFAHLSKEKEGKVRKKERIHKNKISVRKRLNSLKKKRTLARKKSTIFSNKKIKLQKRCFKGKAATKPLLKSYPLKPRVLAKAHTSLRRRSKRRFAKSFSKVLYKTSPKQRKHLFSNQGLTVFGRVFLRKKERPKQMGRVLGKKKVNSPLKAPQEPKDLKAKDLTTLNGKKPNSSSKKSRPSKVLKSVKVVRRGINRSLRLKSLKALRSKRKKTKTSKTLKKVFKQSLNKSLWQKRLLNLQGLSTKLEEKRTRLCAKGNALSNTRNKSKPLNPRAIRCFIRSIAKTQGYFVVQKLKKIKLAVKQKSTKGKALGNNLNQVVRQGFRKPLSPKARNPLKPLRKGVSTKPYSQKGSKGLKADKAGKKPVKTLPKSLGGKAATKPLLKPSTLKPLPKRFSKALAKAPQAKAATKLYASSRLNSSRSKSENELTGKAAGQSRYKALCPPKHSRLGVKSLKSLKTRKSMRPTKSLVASQPRVLKSWRKRLAISKLNKPSKDFWKKKFSSKKAFLQVSLASAFLSSCWREKLFAIRAQLLHNFFLCESLSLLPVQSVWQRKRNKFKKSTALGYLEEHLQRIYQSQVQILPIKLKSSPSGSANKSAETVFCYQSALVLAQQLARALEKKKIRTYRQVVRTALKQAKDASWLQGVRITCSGRLGRVDLAKQETKASGETSLHVFSKKIDYGFASARTKKVGIVGIKVWLSFV
jgi:hypothetical protein